MGMKDWLDGIKKKVDERHHEETDPAKIRAAKKEQNERNMKRAAKAMQLAQKGLKTYNEVSKKAGEITDAVADKTADLAEKAKPIAGKIDEVAGKVGDAASGAFKAVKDKVVDGAEAAGEKIADATKPNPDKPTTGSGLLDLFAPAVPKDVVPKKEDKKDAPKPPQP